MRLYFLAKTASEVGTLIRLFASDLDGTLYNALHETDRGITRRLRRVVDAGRHVALATGRWSSTAAELGFGDLPLEVVSANGAFVYAPGGRLIRSVAIDPAVLEELLGAFPTACFVCIAPEGTFVRGSRDQQEASYVAPAGILERLVARRARVRNDSFAFDQTDAQVLGHQVCKVNCRALDAGLKAEVDAFVREHAGALVNASFDGDLFELTEASVNKGESLAWLADHLGIAENEVAVYGDGGNDLAMLERFDHAYATSNASSEAKRAAGTVIGSCALHAVPRHMLATVRSNG